MIHDFEYDEYGVVHRPFGPIIYEQEVSDELFDELKTIIPHSTDDYRINLAGNIADERDLTKLISDKAKEELRERTALYLSLCMEKPQHQFPHFMNGLDLESIWVNFQKAWEWNPPHKHTGDVSFVIYIDNPVNAKEERKHPTQHGNAPTAGHITFRYGETHTLSGDRLIVNPKPKQMFLFPAWLEHQVFPFTQEGITRISVAGNMHVTPDNASATSRYQL
jgi:hypothetical protein